MSNKKMWEKSQAAFELGTTTETLSSDNSNETVSENAQVVFSEETLDIIPEEYLLQVQLPDQTLSLNDDKLAISRDIEAITKEIIFHKNQAENSFIEMGQLLIEAKKELKNIGHGLWLEWLRNNVELSTVTAQRLMRLAEEFTNASPVTHLGFTKASIILTLPRDERDSFMEELHEINGSQKRVSDMSKRELEDAVKERKKNKVKVNSTAVSTMQSFPAIYKKPLTTVKQESKASSEPVNTFYINLDLMKKCIDNMLNFVTNIPEYPDMCDELIMALRTVCEKTLLDIPVTELETV